jgi:hypothetical protein
MDNIFENAHGFDMVMIPITYFDDEIELELGLDKGYKKEVDNLKKHVPHLIDHVYFLPNNNVYPFAFYKDNVHLNVYGLSWEVWEHFRTVKTIEYLLHGMEEAKQQEDYDTIFSLMEKKILIPRYIHLFDEIPFNQKYQIFRDVWVRSEYGFDQELYEIIENQQSITVYRGVTEKSTPYDKGISWTLDEKVAEWFGKRFGSEGDIIKAEININDVHDFISRRNEKEVLLNPSKLNNIQVYKNL